MTTKLLVICYMIFMGFGATAGNDLMVHTSDGNFLRVNQLDETPNMALLTRYDSDGIPYDRLVFASTGELSVGFLVHGWDQTTLLAGSYSGTLFSSGLGTRVDGSSFLIVVDQEVHEPIILPGQIVGVAVNTYGEFEVLCKEDGLVKYIFDPNRGFPLENTSIETFTPFIQPERSQDPVEVQFVIQPENQP